MREARSPSKASPSKAQTYRRKAQTCGQLADCARSESERDPLLRMRDALLSRAANEDRLDGLPPLPPANSNALMARHA
jgi:hypothetical protein